jgi:hypothetical protein
LGRKIVSLLSSILAATVLAFMLLLAAAGYEPARATT